MTDGWREVRLADIAEIIVSNVDKKSRTGELPVRLCNYTDVYKNSVVHSKMPFMDATATPAQIEKYGLRSGDIIITKDSESPDDIAVPTFVEEATADLLCGYHLAIVRTRDCIDGRFLKYCFEAPQTRVYFKRKANGATRFGLTVSSIEEAIFRIPRLQLQHKIVDILRTWDEAIEKLEALRTEKERLLRRFYSAVFKPGSPINRFWEEYRIGEFLIPRGEYALPKANLPLYSLTIEDGVTPKGSVTVFV